MGRRDRALAADTASRRLAALSADLGRELGREPDTEPEPGFVPEPGRHARRRGGARSSVRAALADRVPDTLRGRVGLSPQHGTVVLAVVGVALALAGWLALRSGAHDDVVPRAELVSTGSMPTLSTGPGASPAADASPGSGTTVVVDVAGRVRRPGIVTLPAGSRVHDALRRAGGVRSGVRLASLNLARPLVDGEQIVVGRPAPSGIAPSAVGGSPAQGAMVHLNTAGLSELDTLPGVGPVTAQKILDWRTAHGAFSAVDELLEVDGIGEKTLADIAPHATL